MAFRLKTLYEITRHPLTRNQPLAALERYARFHLSQLIFPHPVVYPWIGPLKLLVRRGWAGVVGNVYTGLYDFEDMGFLLHCLQPGELFIDVGANAGVYALLAAGLCQARVLACEPIPETFAQLENQIRLNQLAARIDARQTGLSDRPGKLRFSLHHGTMNHVVTRAEPGEPTVEVPVNTLDALVTQPVRMLKLDTEGFELPVLKGAQSILAGPDLQAVLIELNGSGARYGYQDRDCDTLLKSHGFAPYRYLPLERRFEPLAAWRGDQYNTLYLREIERLRSLAAVSQPIEVLAQRF